jgi:hypothetical protein
MHHRALRRPFALSLSLTGLLAVAACAADDEPAASSTGSDSGDSGSSESNGSSTTGSGGTGTATSGGTSGTSDTTTAGTTSGSTSGTTSASTTGSTGTTTTGATTDTTDGGFITPPDGGVMNQCDPGAQDCQSDEEKCTAFATMAGTCCVDANKCVPIIGNQQFGDPCIRMDDNDNCDKGLFCMTTTSAAEGDGFCLELCTVGEPCDNGGQCLAFNDGVLPLCQVSCDPLLQDCPGMQNCYAAFNDFICANPGFEAGLGNDGDPCQAIQSCREGLVCAGATADCDDPGGSCCTPFCDVSGPAGQCSNPMEQCVAWFAPGEGPPGSEDVGACTVPQ